jgi:hypothetical protein
MVSLVPSVRTEYNHPDVHRSPEICRALFLRRDMSSNDHFKYAAHDYQTINVWYVA